MEKHNMLVTFQGYGSFEVVMPRYGNLRLEQGKVYYIVNAGVEVLEFLRSLYPMFVRVNVDPTKVDKADAIIDYDKLRAKTKVEANEKVNLSAEIAQPVVTSGLLQVEGEVIPPEGTLTVTETVNDPAKFVWRKGKNKGKTVAELDKLGKLTAVLRTATDEEKAVIEAYRQAKGE